MGTVKLLWYFAWRMALLGLASGAALGGVYGAALLAISGLYEEFSTNLPGEVPMGPVQVVLAAWLLRRSAFASAAAALLVAFGLFAVVPKVTGPPMEPVAFSGAPPGVEAEASLIDHTWGTETVLVASGLEDGETYRLTLRDEDGGAAPSGTFIGTGDRPLECRMNAALLREEATGLEVRTAEGDLVLEADLPEGAPGQAATPTGLVRGG